MDNKNFTQRFVCIKIYQMGFEADVCRCVNGEEVSFEEYQIAKNDMRKNNGFHRVSKEDMYELTEENIALFD